MLNSLFLALLLATSPVTEETKILEGVVIEDKACTFAADLSSIQPHTITVAAVDPCIPIAKEEGGVRYVNIPIFIDIKGQSCYVRDATVQEVDGIHWVIFLLSEDCDLEKKDGI
jgi:hypothetical protein